MFFSNKSASSASAAAAGAATRASRTAVQPRLTADGRIGQVSSSFGGGDERAGGRAGRALDPRLSHGRGAGKSWRIEAGTDAVSSVQAAQALFRAKAVGYGGGPAMSRC